MKILISSNAPFVNSGYGIQSYYLSKILLELGHEVIFLAWNFIISKNARDQKLPYESIKHIALKTPNIYDEDVLNEKEDVCGKIQYYTCIYENFPCLIDPKDVNKIIDKEKIDVFIHLLDIWIINVNSVPFSCYSIVWLPFHFYPIEETTLNATNIFSKIAFLSEFGKRIYIESESNKKLAGDVIPHIIDYEDLNKYNKYDRNNFREKIGVPKDAYLISFIARNSEESNRKTFDLNLCGFKKFFDKVGKNAYLYIHTIIDLKCNIVDIANFYQIPLNQIIVPDQNKIKKNGLENDYMVGIYRSSDILLMATCSEGFGLPLLEAQLLGCPVVATDCTAMTEYTYNGELVDVIDLKYVYVNSSYWYLPDPDSICDKLYKIFMRTKEENEIKCKKGQQIINNKFSLQCIKKQWKDILQFS